MIDHCFLAAITDSAVVTFYDTIAARYMCSSEPQCHVPARSERCEVTAAERGIIIT